SQTATFSAGGATTQPVTLDILDDGVQNPFSKTFTLSITSVSSNATYSTPVVTAIHVQDSDRPLPTVSIGDLLYTKVNEGGSFTIPVKLSASPASNVTVQVNTTGMTAIEGANYYGIHTTLTFLAGTSILLQNVIVQTLPPDTHADQDK